MFSICDYASRAFNHACCFLDFIDDKIEWLIYHTRCRIPLEEAIAIARKKAGPQFSNFITKTLFRGDPVEWFAYHLDQHIRIYGVAGDEGAVLVPRAYSNVVFKRHCGKLLTFRHGRQYNRLYVKRVDLDSYIETLRLIVHDNPHL